MCDTDDLNLWIAREVRIALDAVRTKMARQQLGECNETREAVTEGPAARRAASEIGT
jgi:hypothetical protein